MAYVSKLYSKEFVIDDSNWRQHVEPIVDGQKVCRGLIPRDFSTEPYAGYAASFSLPLIPRYEWRDRIEEMERTKSRLSDLMKQARVPCKSQLRTNFCWIFAAVTAAEIARLIQGQPYVELSPASVGAPMTSYRNVGGWSTPGLKFSAEHGIAPVSLWPAAAIDRRYDTEESRRERMKFRPMDWMEVRPRNFDEKMTLLLNRMCIAEGYNWWRHAVTAVDPVVLDGTDRFGSRDRNSWGSNYGEDGYFILEEGRATPDDAVAPIVAMAA